ncbi:MAG: hypothetical protein WCP96_14845 [Methylococcaceae bacterium]
MNNNIPAQSEQQITQAQNLDDLTKAFAQVCFMYGCIINDAAISHVSNETANSRFFWLAEEAAKLAAVSSLCFTGGAKQAKQNNQA